VSNRKLVLSNKIAGGSTGGMSKCHWPLRTVVPLYPVGISMSAPVAHLKRSSARRYLWLLVRLAVGIGLVVYLVRSGAIELRLLSKLLSDWPLSVAGVALIFLDIALMALRLSCLLSPRGFNLSFANSLKLTLVSAFFATFLPGTTGGDIAKLFYATKENKGRRTEIVTVVIFDRVFGLFSVLLLPLLFAPFFSEFSRAVAVLRVLLIASALLSLCLLGGLLVCLFASAAVSRVLAWGFRFLSAALMPAQKVVERAVKTIGEYRHNPGALAAALGLSMAANLSLIAVTALAIFLLHPASMTMKMFIIVPLGDVANSLPLTPGGLGVGEATYNALFRVAGLEGGADALLCWRIWRATVGLIGLVFYLRGLEGTVQDANANSVPEPVEQIYP
jgi:glycosyltransferase 2 family protein